MSTKLLFPLMAGVALCVLALGSAQAQQAPKKQGWQVRLGMLGAATPDYEGSDDYRFRPFPDIEITYDNTFFLDRRGVGANLIQSGPLTTGVTLGYDGGRKERRNRALRGLGNVGDTAVAGAFANYQIGRWMLTADVNTDLLGDGHDGTTADLGFSYVMRPSNDMMIIIGPSVTWASDNYMQSYFGINAAQAARSGRAVYRAEAGFKDAGLLGFGTYKLTQNWSLTAVAGYSRLLGDAADSPLVDRDGSANQFFGGLGVSYSF
ncbi:MULTISPECIES: MipA/OmpV family protein [unclassified Azospirillum]|uniref:MipA/OmpV family protein n=1 Tax=unclassified Azospirillum TaxID=2630922 RepID=UPI000B629CBE|nr:MULTISPECIES: MipA/OmpV family protein [unclassified Azospirillum]SNT04435.1 Outer membrane scaffolding protein for murein synthesis, MipA/OmpV family [Azospirillum sp. RU38E]SNT19991.1 Outer membrane scaffolding protein for murein synthesis, MipA/OmpV family [Azospirillum sp. RU37A]